MNAQDKNIVLITAGGRGCRFGGTTPKQYLMLNGKAVIEYVIEACQKSKLADAVLISCEYQYHAGLRSRYAVDVTQSGETLNITKRRGFDFIKKNSTCEKLVVVEAVRPMLTAELIDRTFELLDEYEAVACARNITDSLGCYHQWGIHRSSYYTMNLPEGFHFPLLEQHFQENSTYTESIPQLPETTNVYLNFDVPYLDKITYPEDLAKMEAYLSRTENHQ